MTSKFVKDSHSNDLSKSIRKVMVTGADGFIGHALCKKLLDDNYEIKGVVRSKNYNSRSIEGIDTSQLNL